MYFGEKKLDLALELCIWFLSYLYRQVGEAFKPEFCRMGLSRVDFRTIFSFCVSKY